MKPISRRHILTQLPLGIAGAVSLGFPFTSLAQSAYPNRPVRVVVPWPAGGLVDIPARILCQRLQQIFGQPFVVENKLGAGGSIGADAVAKSPTDGHHLLFSTSALSFNVAMKSKVPFDFLRDLEAVSHLAQAPSILVVGPSIQANNVQELIQLARSKPGRLSYGSAGIGSPAHLTGELFKSLQNLFIVHIPYTGAPAAINDQLAGRIDFQFANAAVALPQVRAGKMKALAVTGNQRFSALPLVPTMVEAGVPHFEADQWLGLFAPKGLPKSISDRLNDEINKLLSQEDFKAEIVKAGVIVASPIKANAFDQTIRNEINKWSGVVKTANIQPE